MNTITKTRQIEPDVLDVLAQADCAGNTLRIRGGQLDRKLYLRVNEVLEALGGTWDRRAKAHVLEGIAADAVEHAVLTGTYTRSRQDFGFFETPEMVVGRMIAKAEIEPGLRYLEPNAGHGAIALPILGLLQPKALHCYEILDANVKKLDEKIRLCGYNPPELLVMRRDFLEVPPTPNFDRVLMNPPFAKRADIAHITHALGFLKRGGILVSVASASVKFRTDSVASSFRQMLASYAGSIEALPEGSFRESGTMVNTVLVTMRRPG